MNPITLPFRLILALVMIAVLFLLHGFIEDRSAQS